MFLIGLEEHFATPEMQELNCIKFAKGYPRFDINDVGAGRIAHMDEAGIDMQVLSALTPGAQNLPGQQGIDFARKTNDWLAREVIPAYPDRFRAFSVLPLASPEASAEELERTVQDYGFLGTMVYGFTDGKFLDDPIYAPLLAKAEALGVPIYIHPNFASQAAMQLYYDALDDPWVSKILSGPGYGWHQEVAICSLRLVCRGIFDKYPNLQIIIGHMGEAIPFYYYRFGDDLTAITKDRLNKPIQQYFNDNFWITTSAFFSDELLRLALSVMGEDRVMFSVDYPFVSNKLGTDWFHALDLPQATKEKIAHKNAERLLKIGPF